MDTSRDDELVGLLEDVPPDDKPTSQSQPLFDINPKVEHVQPPLRVGIEMRNEVFRWSKPPEMDKPNLSLSARLARAVAIEKHVRKQDVVLRLVCRQLRKANEERYSLMQELQGYRGSDRDNLHRENLVLREMIDRVTKENLRLHASATKEKITSARRRREEGHGFQGR